MNQELYKKHRPITLDQVVGQPSAIKQLKGFLTADKVPAALLFTGESGTGKTTLARIMAREVGATGMDIIEMNAAQSRGIDDVRDLQNKAQLRSMSGGAKVVIVDECHKITADAQAAMLKMLEDIPAGQFYFLCTSNPEKISKAIQTRLTKISLSPIPGSAMGDLLVSVCVAENIAINKKDAESIIKAAQGSARTALVTLDAYRHSGFDAGVLESLTQLEEAPESIFKLCLELMNPKSWANAYSLASSVEVDAVEGVRHMILNYAGSQLKDQKTAPRALAIIRCFHAPFFDSKKPGFLAACFSSWNAK